MATDVIYKNNAANLISASEIGMGQGPRTAIGSALQGYKQGVAFNIATDPDKLADEAAIRKININIAREKIEALRSEQASMTDSDDIKQSELDYKKKLLEYKNADLDYKIKNIGKEESSTEKSGGKKDTKLDIIKSYQTQLESLRQMEENLSKNIAKSKEKSANKNKIISGQFKPGMGYGVPGPTEQDSSYPGMGDDEKRLRTLQEKIQKNLETQDNLLKSYQELAFNSQLENENDQISRQVSDQQKQNAIITSAKDTKNNLSQSRQDSLSADGMNIDAFSSNIIEGAAYLNKTKNPEIQKKVAQLLSDELTEAGGAEDFLSIIDSNPDWDDDTKAKVKDSVYNVLANIEGTEGLPREQKIIRQSGLSTEHVANPQKTFSMVNKWLSGDGSDISDSNFKKEIGLHPYTIAARKASKNGKSPYKILPDTLPTGNPSNGIDSVGQAPAEQTVLTFIDSDGEVVATAPMPKDDKDLAIWDMLDESKKQLSAVNEKQPATAEQAMQSITKNTAQATELASKARLDSLPTNAVVSKLKTMPIGASIQSNGNTYSTVPDRDGSPIVTMTNSKGHKFWVSRPYTKFDRNGDYRNYIEQTTGLKPTDPAFRDELKSLKDDREDNIKKVTDDLEDRYKIIQQHQSTLDDYGTLISLAEDIEEITGINPLSAQGNYATIWENINKQISAGVAVITDDRRKAEQSKRERLLLRFEGLRNKFSIEQIQAFAEALDASGPVNTVPEMEKIEGLAIQRGESIETAKMRHTILKAGLDKLVQLNELDSSLIDSPSDLTYVDFIKYRTDYANSDRADISNMFVLTDGSDGAKLNRNYDIISAKEFLGLPVDKSKTTIQESQAQTQQTVANTRKQDTTTTSSVPTTTSGVAPDLVTSPGDIEQAEPTPPQMPETTTTSSVPTTTTSSVPTTTTSSVPTTTTTSTDMGTTTGVSPELYANPTMASNPQQVRVAILGPQSGTTTTSTRPVVNDIANTGAEASEILPESSGVIAGFGKKVADAYDYVVNFPKQMYDGFVKDVSEDRKKRIDENLKNIDKQITPEDFQRRVDEIKKSMTGGPDAMIVGPLAIPGNSDLNNLKQMASYFADSLTLGASSFAEEKILKIIADMKMAVGVDPIQALAEAEAALQITEDFGVDNPALSLAAQMFGYVKGTQAIKSLGRKGLSVAAPRLLAWYDKLTKGTGILETAERTAFQIPLRGKALEITADTAVEIGQSIMETIIDNKNQEIQDVLQNGLIIGGANTGVNALGSIIGVVGKASVALSHKIPFTIGIESANNIIGDVFQKVGLGPKRIQELFDMQKEAMERTGQDASAHPIIMFMTEKEIGPIANYIKTPEFKAAITAASERGKDGWLEISKYFNDWSDGKLKELGVSDEYIPTQIELQKQAVETTKDVVGKVRTDTIPRAGDRLKSAKAELDTALSPIVENPDKVIKDIALDEYKKNADTTSKVLKEEGGNKIVKTLKTILDDDYKSASEAEKELLENLTITGANDIGKLIPPQANIKVKSEDSIAKVQGNIKKRASLDTLIQNRLKNSFGKATKELDSYPPELLQTLEDTVAEFGEIKPTGTPKEVIPKPKPKPKPKAKGKAKGRVKDESIPDWLDEFNDDTGMGFSDDAYIENNTQTLGTEIIDRYKRAVAGGAEDESVFGRMSELVYQVNHDPNLTPSQRDNLIASMKATIASSAVDPAKKETVDNLWASFKAYGKLSNIAKKNKASMQDVARIREALSEGNFKAVKNTIFDSGGQNQQKYMDIFGEEATNQMRKDVTEAQAALETVERLAKSMEDGIRISEKDLNSLNLPEGIKKVIQFSGGSADFGTRLMNSTPKEISLIKRSLGDSNSKVVRVLGDSVKRGIRRLIDSQPLTKIKRSDAPMSEYLISIGQRRNIEAAVGKKQAKEIFKSMDAWGEATSDLAKLKEMPVEDFLKSNTLTKFVKNNDDLLKSVEFVGNNERLGDALINLKNPTKVKEIISRLPSGAQKNMKDSIRRSLVDRVKTIESTGNFSALESMAKSDTLTTVRKVLGYDDDSWAVIADQFTKEEREALTTILDTKVRASNIKVLFDDPKIRIDKDYLDKYASNYIRRTEDTGGSYMFDVIGYLSTVKASSIQKQKIARILSNPEELADALTTAKQRIVKKFNIHGDVVYEWKREAKPLIKPFVKPFNTPRKAAQYVVAYYMGREGKDEFRQRTQNTDYNKLSKRDQRIKDALDIINNEL